MKKIIPVLLIICICLTLGGCSGNREESNAAAESNMKTGVICGRERVEALRAEAAGWESGRYLFTDLDTGETNQVFSFMYNPDGSQTYLYERIVDGVYYAEYNDGEKLYLFDGESISIINEENTNYVSYSRNDPHPYSTGDLLFYVKEYIRSSGEFPLDQGAVTYVHEYDTAGMNKAIGTSLTDFSVAYTFDSQGNFLYLTQSNNGSEGSYAYMIETLDVNSVTEIENPAD